MNIFEMQKNRDAALARARKVLDLVDAEDREMTASEQASYDREVAAAESLNRQIDAENRRTPNFGDGAVPLNLVQTTNSRPIHQLQQPSYEPAGDPRHSPRIEASAPRVSMKAFANTHEGRDAAYTSGKWLAATLLQDPGSYSWCQSRGLMPDIMAAAGTAPNTAGGALVPTELESSIISLREEYGVFRRVARLAPMSSNTLDIPRSTGQLTASFVGENQEGDESDATWDNVQLNAKKLMVLTRMSSEISEDAIISLADWFASDIAQAFALKEDQCGFIGDGTSTYGGMLGALVKALDGSHDKAKVAAASGHDTLAEIDSDDLVKLMAAIPGYAKRGSRWYCSPTALELVFNAIKVGATGNSLDNLANEVTPRFLGYPIEVTDLMADDAAATYNGAVMIGFGNLMQAATMGDRRGIRVQATSERYWEQDQIGVKGTERFDINVHDLGSNTAKSPFAVLVGTT